LPARLRSEPELMTVKNQNTVEMNLKIEQIIDIAEEKSNNVIEKKRVKGIRENRVNENIDYRKEQALTIEKQTENEIFLLYKSLTSSLHVLLLLYISEMASEFKTTSIFKFSCPKSLIKLLIFLRVNCNLLFSSV
jgi:hypothetical protein